MQDSVIFKSLVGKYTDEDIKYLSGLCSFVSYARLLNLSINDAIRIKPNEVLVGIAIDSAGIKVYIETL